MGKGDGPSLRRWANSRRVGSISSKPSGGAFVFLVRILGMFVRCVGCVGCCLGGVSIDRSAFNISPGFETLKSVTPHLRW
jgi:hypothetical protein